MMKIKKLFLYVLPALLLPGCLAAQDVPKGSLNIFTENVRLHTDGEKRLSIEFDINPGGILVSADEQLVMNPLITDHRGNSLALPSVFVNGRRRNRVERRMKQISRHTPEPEMVYKVVRAGRKGGVDKIRYRAAVAYEPWMDNAGLYLQSEFCGCGGNGQEFAERLVSASMGDTAPGLAGRDGEDGSGSGTVTGSTAVSPGGASGTLASGGCALTPYITFLEPAREEVKRRSEEGSAYITYLPGSALLQPSLADNHGELEKIAESLSLAGSDAQGSLAVTGVSITSWASPEGSWDANMKLSQKRAEALGRYIEDNFVLPSGCAPTCEGRGEDWEKLAELVQADPHVESKAEVLRIMTQVGVFDGREKQLMDLAGGRPYRYLMQRHFPALRRSDYRIEYTVPVFDLAHGREVLEHRPGMLSQYELYRIAFSYPMGSPLFCKVFHTARILFPTDRTSQFNLGATCLLEGKAGEAGALLQGFENDPLAWNNLGVLYMMQGRYRDAHAYLNRAVGSGNREAVENLKILAEMWNPEEK